MTDLINPRLVERFLEVLEDFILCKFVENMYHREITIIRDIDQRDVILIANS